MVNKDIIDELIKSFSQELQSRRTTTKLYNKPFINSENEFIACPAINAYFRLEDCFNRKDVVAKALNYLSRDASKSVIPDHYKKFIRDGLNNFLGTSFDEDDFLIIYEQLGNGVNNNLTLDFIDLEFDLAIFRGKSC